MISEPQSEPQMTGKRYEENNVFSNLSSVLKFYCDTKVTGKRQTNDKQTTQRKQRIFKAFKDFEILL